MQFTQRKMNEKYSLGHRNPSLWPWKEPRPNGMDVEKKKLPTWGLDHCHYLLDVFFFRMEFTQNLDTCAYAKCLEQVEMPYPFSWGKGPIGAWNVAHQWWVVYIHMELMVLSGSATTNVEVYMSHFSYSCKTEWENGISRLISALCVNCKFTSEHYSGIFQKYSRIIDYSIIWMCIWYRLIEKLEKSKIWPSCFHLNSQVSFKL